MKKIAYSLLLLLAGVILFAGCTMPQTTPVTPAPTTAPPATTAPATPAPITETITVVSNPQYGQILTDANGMTLYYFLKDTRGAMTSACTGACSGIWPAFHAAPVQVDSPLLASNFDDFTRADGTMQTTFLGWPLYYYAPDTAPGDTKGYGFNNLWYVVSPSGIVTLAPTTTVPTTMPTTIPTTVYSGGGGY
jgi:predicted lipoprotein with Yx(FWY)xxD motif